MIFVDLYFVSWKVCKFYEPFNEIILMGRNLVRKDKKIEKEWIKQEIISVHIGY